MRARELWPSLLLPALLLVVFLVALTGEKPGNTACAGFQDQWVTTLDGHCVRLVPK
jgi:hypothetical protein